MLFFVKILLFIYILIFITPTNALTIPKKDNVLFDIIRKNKIIGSHEIVFEKNENNLIIKTNINIKVKALFIPVYKFSHQSNEIWKDGNFIKIDGHTDFEDEREYFIKGVDEKDLFIANGMDGKLKIDKDILPSNLWNFDILKQKELFDTQKGIVRTIIVKDLGSEKITINDKVINSKKFTFNASNNPKDKGPFPEYTLWYNKNNELVKYEFINWKDDKLVQGIRRE
tara:strand:+ start:457 stop:1137 length:681 start_codon:yes stop_codon:yes gene_type:complete